MHFTVKELEKGKDTTIRLVVSGLEGDRVFLVWASVQDCGCDDSFVSIEVEEVTLGEPMPI